MGDGVLADPAFIDGFAGELVTGVRGQADAVRLIVQGGMNHAHPEGDKITGLKIRAQPAAAEFVSQEIRAFRQDSRKGVMRPELLASGDLFRIREICAIAVHVTLKVAFEKMVFFVGILKNHQCALFHRNVAVGNPCGKNIECAASHINNVTMGIDPRQAAGDGSEPAEIKRAHFPAQKSFIKRKDGLAKNHFLNRLAAHGVFRRKSYVFVRRGDSVHQRMIRVQVAVLFHFFEQFAPGVKNILAVENPFEIEVTILFHSGLHCPGVSKNVSGITQGTKMLRGIVHDDPLIFQGGMGQCGCCHNEKVIRHFEKINGLFGKKHVYFGYMSPAIKFHSRIHNHHVKRLGGITITGHLENSPGISSKKMRVLGKYALVYILRGRGRYRDEKGREYEFFPGSLLSLFPDIAHSYEPVDKRAWDEIYFIFSGAQFDLLRKLGIMSPDKPVRHPEPLDYWRERFLSLIGHPVCSSEKQAAGEAMALAALLTEIHLSDRELQPGPDENEKWLSQAKTMLSSSTGKEIDFRQIARRMNVSYETFRKRFTQLAGLPPGRYHMRKIMEKAASMIAHEHLSNKDIADKLGFCDEFHFSKRFRSVMGMSPRSYRLCLPRP